jgi:tetratricopeptide (TPR) repeat protein
VYNLGVVAQDDGREADAIVLYTRALELDPGLAEAHYNLATLFDQSGDSRSGDPPHQRVPQADALTPRGQGQPGAGRPWPSSTSVWNRFRIDAAMSLVAPRTAARCSMSSTSVAPGSAAREELDRALERA